MRKLLAAALTRMRKTPLFWGTLLLEIAFALFRVWTSYQDKKTGYEITTDELLFSYILTTGLVMAVFISMFLGTEYHDGTIRNKFVAGHSRTAIYFANLAAVLTACLLFTAAYLVTALAAGSAVFGPPTMNASVLAAVFAGTLTVSAAFCAIYTLIAMNCSHKATSAIICILLFFGLLCASTYLFAMLDAQPERLVIDMVNGEMVSHMEPNPHYIQGRKREIYQFLVDFLPTGQATEYILMTPKPLLSLYSAVIFLLSSAGGVVFFRKKDVK